MALPRFILGAGMGAVVGGLGACVGSLMQVGRLPPPAQAAGAAAFMGTMFGVGSVVRTR